jgi:hypothetical protein
MGEKTRTRTISIAETSMNDLSEISQIFHITKSTLIKISIEHGLKRLQHGYLPLRDKRKKRKNKIKITLPDAEWIKFQKAKNDLKWKLRNPITDNELITIFIEIEMSSFMQYIKQAERNPSYSLYNSKEITGTFDVPEHIYAKLKQIQNNTGVLDSQIWKYMLASAFTQEYLFKDIKSITTDLDLLEEIEQLGLNRVKTFTLLKYLIANNRIIWND